MKLLDDPPISTLADYLELNTPTMLTTLHARFRWPCGQLDLVDAKSQRECIEDVLEALGGEDYRRKLLHRARMAAV